MTSPMCMRCLERSFVGLNIDLAGRHSQRGFATSAARFAQPVKKKTVSGKPAKPALRGGSSLRLSKNKRVSTGRPPAPGDRKASRKKVVLSNDNALEVAGLEDLTPAHTSPEQLRKFDGQVLGFDASTVEKLRALEGFKPTQGWGLFRRPATLIRKETIKLAESLDRAAGSEKDAVRTILIGERDGGKSVLQLQTLAMAALKGWIVIHIPEAKDLTNAHTAYEPVTHGDHTLYDQPHYTAKLLTNIKNANQNILEQLRLTHQHKLPIPVQDNISLDRFVELGARDADLAVPIWRALQVELHTRADSTKTGAQRPPVLYTIDSLHQIMRSSAYLDAEARPLHAHQLTLVHDLMQLLSPPSIASKLFPNGGMVLAATSASNHVLAPTLDALLQRRQERQKKREVTPFDPYSDYDERVCAVFGDIPSLAGSLPASSSSTRLKLEASTAKPEDHILVTEVRGLSKPEARGVMEYYARSGMLQAAVTDGLVAEKWTLSGGGIVGQIEKVAVSARF